jgi:hypothetical protein
VCVGDTHTLAPLLRLPLVRLLVYSLWVASFYTAEEVTRTLYRLCEAAHSCVRVCVCVCLLSVYSQSAISLRRALDLRLHVLKELCLRGKVFGDAFPHDCDR